METIFWMKFIFFSKTVNWLHADIPLFLRANIGNIMLLKHRNVIEAPVIFEHLPVSVRF
jgi:hypothetical protein